MQKLKTILIKHYKNSENFATAFTITGERIFINNAIQELEKCCWFKKTVDTTLISQGITLISTLLVSKAEATKCYLYLQKKNKCKKCCLQWALED
jgi:hypothetical protein